MIKFGREAEIDKKKKKKKKKNKGLINTYEHIEWKQ